MLLTHLPGVSQSEGRAATPILFTWIAISISGFTMHRFARAFVGANAALIATTLYLANPYMLFKWTNIPLFRLHPVLRRCISR